MFRRPPHSPNAAEPDQALLRCGGFLERRLKRTVESPMRTAVAFRRLPSRPVTLHFQHLTFLTTSFGKPFTEKGFGNGFRDRCDEADLTQCSSDGLRKAISRRMAEIGLSHSQAKAITGHITDKEYSLRMSGQSRGFGGAGDG